MASYYCPTAILTDAQKAPTTFSLAVPALSHSPLNNNSGTPITPATTLDLPLWLAEMLAVSRPSGPASAPLATLEMPSALGPKVMNALTADATSVELRQQAQWFYGLGERMLELFEDEEMGAVLLNTFKKRALEIADKAQNTRTAQQGGDSGDFMSGLDETERQLFRAAHDGTHTVKRWFEATSRG
ncbi:DNA replication protein [Friedmanniomyces endolithicus]|nr:DNA replication protein [Friedmanniomyces endolithicus]